MDSMLNIAPATMVIILKRVMDIFFALLGLCLLIALFPLIAIAIKLDTSGPIFYKQTRIGRNNRTSNRRDSYRRKILFLSNRRASAERRSNNLGGKPFSLVKFRTMRLDAEKNGPQLCAKKGDPRITHVGKWLRYFHLDELPQFWNMLVGDMSLIGPRPERPFFTEQYLKEIPYYEERTRHVKPGITGLAQITLGYDESLQTVNHKYTYDVTYRFAMTSVISWLRIESWIFVNTIRYLFNQLAYAFKALSHKRANNNLSPHISVSFKQIHIAHPWKLIDRITTNKASREIWQGVRSADYST